MNTITEYNDHLLQFTSAGGGPGGVNKMNAYTVMVVSSAYELSDVIFWLNECILNLELMRSYKHQ